MFWADRITKLAGVVVLVFAALLVVSAALELGTTDANPMARGDTEEMLRELNDKQALSALLIAVNIATDAVVMVAVAAVLYLLFRDRSGALALIGALGVLAGGIAFAATDAAAVTLSYLAIDFVEEGGAGGIAAGDPVILQSARVVGVLSMASALAGFTSIGLGFVAVGALIASAPEGAVNPPRWLGALAVAGGLLAPSGWLSTANFETGMTLLSISMVAALIFTVILGGWLLFQTEREARAVTGLAPST